MKSRRQFIQIVPAAAGLSLLAACGQKETPPAVATSSPAPAPAAPAPVAATPAPAAAPAAAPATATAESSPMVDEKDPQALSLGYVADASKADKTKFASYAAGQNCAGCALYSGKAGDAAGGCGIFAGKQVTAAGWCSAFNKKA